MLEQREVGTVDGSYRQAAGGGPRVPASIDAYRDIVDLLVDSAPADEALLRIAVAAETVSGGCACAIQRLDESGKMLRRAAAPNLPETLLQRIEQLGIGADRGLCGSAVFRREPVYMDEFSDAPAGAAINEAARSCGFRGGRSWPLVNAEGRVLGTFSIYFRREHAIAVDCAARFEALARLALLALEFERRGTAAHTADRRLASLAVNVPGVLYQRRVSPDGDIRYTYISDGAKDLFGVPAEEVLADPNALFRRHGPEYAATFRDRLMAASRALTIWDVEAVIDTPDGERKYTHAIARPERQPDGSVLWNGIILDQTRIKKAEMAAAASEARTREAIVESISEGICLYDSSEKLIACNSHFVEMFPDAKAVAEPGTSYEDIVRAEMPHYVDAEREGIQDAVRERLEMHQRSSFTSEQRTKGGRSLLVSERRAADGSTVILYADITEIKRREEERSQLQEQFYRAQKTQAIGRLAGGIAHDFNNILAAIVGNAYFLVEDLPEGSDQLEFAQQICTAAERAKNLVQQILQFSRQQNSEQALIDPDSLVTEAVDLLRATLPKTIELKVTKTNGGVAIRGNQTHLVQVLMNLCVNARDAIGERRGSIEVAMKLLDASGEPASLPHSAGEKAIRLGDGRTQVQVGTVDASAPYVCISVRDTGCGMDHAVVEKMFEPFFTTKDVGRGTGLGLAAVHGILGEHKAAMLVTSRVGEGTAFELFFPLASKPTETTTVSAATLPTGSERILIVDDEPQVGRMMTNLLGRLGYKATAFTDPAEALAEAQRDPEAWDLVITDQMMPHITGTELARELLTGNPGLPILLCTGFSEGLTEASVKELGLFAFLTKPVGHGELARTVRQALDARHDR